VRTSINRIAEAMTIFAVMCVGMFPLLHLGRPWFFYWLPPYPHTMSLWPQFRSALMWDVFSIGVSWQIYGDCSGACQGTEPARWICLRNAAASSLKSLRFFAARSIVSCGSDLRSYSSSGLNGLSWSNFQSPRRNASMVLPP
jgi:hypothetical protein